MAHLQAALSILAFLGASPLPVESSRDEFQAGVATSAIVLTVYVSVDSERQRQLVASLYGEVEAGRLEGKVKLVVRPLIRDEADELVVRAVHAAAEQGRLWPYLLRLCGEERPPREGSLRKLADLAGLDGDAFDLALQRPAADGRVDSLRSACARDRVAATPSAFLDGRRLAGAPGCEEIVAAVAEHARAAGLDRSSHRR